MRLDFRAVLILMTVAAMGMTGCGHYTCGTGFGSSGCTPSTPSLGGSTGGNTNAAFAFVLDGTAAGQVVGYTLNTSATPPSLSATASYTPPMTPHGDTGLGMAVAQKNFLYAAFASTQQVFGWSIGSAGTLTAVQNTPLTAPLGGGASLSFDIERVATNPAGTVLFVGDAFNDQIFAYQIGSGGVLTAVTGSPFFVGMPPANLTTDGQGKYLYFTDASESHLGSAIGAYAIGSGGALTPVAGTPFIGANFDMWQVVGEPTGAYMIGTKGMAVAVNGLDDNNLYVFTIGPTGGLTLAAGSPFATTSSPYNIAAQPNTGGNLVYTFGLADAGDAFNPVNGYVLSSSGTLAPENGSPFSNANVGDSGQFDQSGGLLFLYGGVLVNNTIAYTLTSFDVASGLTAPTSTGTYGGYWVVTDAP